MGRPSTLYVEVDGVGDEITAVRVGGQVVRWPRAWCGSRAAPKQAKIFRIGVSRRWSPQLVEAMVQQIRTSSELRRTNLPRWPTLEKPEERSGGIKMDIEKAIAYVQTRGDAVERARLAAILWDELPSETALRELAALQKPDGGFAYWVPGVSNVCDTAFVLQ